MAPRRKLKVKRRKPNAGAGNGPAPVQPPGGAGAAGQGAAAGGAKRGAKPHRSAEDVARSVVTGATDRRRAAASRAGAVNRERYREAAEAGRCGANTRKGTACRHPAGYRTDHEGAGLCYLHGGATASHSRAAHKQLVGQEIQALEPVMQAAVPDDLNPVGVLMDYMASAASKTIWLDEQVRGLASEELVATRGQVLERMLGDWSDRGARAAKYLVDVGITGLRAQVAEAAIQAQLLAVKRALEAAGLVRYERVVGAHFRLEITRWNQLQLPPDERGSLDEQVARAERAVTVALEEAELTGGSAPVRDAKVVDEPVEVVDAEPVADSPESDTVVEGHAVPWPPEENGG